MDKKDIKSMNSKSNKIKDYWKKVVSYIPAVMAFALLPFLKGDEIRITIMLIIVIGITFVIEYKKKEWAVLLAGIIIGFLVEFSGDAVYQLQYWEQASFFGLPIWLPILWGYGFVMIRRIGNLITSEIN